LNKEKAPANSTCLRGLKRNKIIDDEEFEDSKVEDYDENAEIEEI
jgi:hypothetical protein